MLNGRDIICFSSIDWDFNWQGHQEIMQRLAAAGNRVLYVENTGVRAPRPSDLGRMRRRLVNWWKSYRGFRRQADNLYIFSPLVLPLPHSRIARWINRRMMSGVLNSWFRSQRFSDPIVWTFLPSRLTMEVIEHIPHKLLIYYCIDSFRHSSPAAGKIEASEREMIKLADLVLVTSEKLAAHCRPHNPNVHKYPFTVDYQFFAGVREDPSSGTPEDLESIPRPRIGYIGGLHRWLDIDLLASLAERLPRVQLVLIGPEQESMAGLRSIPNVHLTGARPHDQLPRYLKGFDIGLIPYRLTDYTQYVHPTKLNEYLAMGLPVVSTPIEEMKLFAGEHSGVVEIGRDAEELARLIERKLAALSGEEELKLRRRRIELAREAGWENSLEQMCSLIERRIEEVRPGDDTGWLERLAAVSHSRRRQFLTIAASLLVLWLLITSSSTVRWLGAPLVATGPVTSSEVILVFGGGVGETGSPGSSTFERAGWAAELYERGLADKIVFSSGYQQLSRRDAEDMRKVASAQGVSETDIILDPLAANNYENVRNCLEIMSKTGFKSALVVTGLYNSRRTRLLLDTQLQKLRLPGVTPDSLRVVPPPESVFFHPDGDRFSQLGAIFHEYAAMLKYWWKGWL
ncbi:MAG: glycosyltransferase [Candidatus Glassbacteria bacterium]|nr:glycosyltransferase [Candidatus Glassbacteria bacterium]